MPRGGGENAKRGITHLRVRFSDTAYLGPGRADLLDEIARTQSISAAGKKLGMSYKRAWGLVQALNAGFPAPLVATQRGGRTQGGAHLTDFGVRCVECYRGMQKQAEAAIQVEFEKMLAEFEVAQTRSEPS